MSSFLIDKNSPISIRTISSGSSKKTQTEPKTRLRHRSRISESEQEFCSSFQRQNSFQENRKPEFENLTSACVDQNEMLNDEMHGDFQNRKTWQRSRSTSSTSMIGYFMSELTKGYKLEDDAREFVERRDRVYTSVYTPKNLEKFCAFGFLQCLDSILYIVTFLPLRILVALMQVLVYPFSMLFRKDSRVLDSAQICDLLKGVVLVVSCFLTSYMDMSMIYHIVRGQSIIKFYVFYNMLDVMDKLISGFGQDVLDSLYWTAVEPRGRKREHFGTIFHLIFAIVYVVLHTVMILIQAIILNVAFNSHNKNLLTIMLSNNFVELKGNLFKRLDKNNLCQITYSDVKERFHYLVLLLFVLIRNMKELEWSWALALPFIQDAVIVFGVEVVVDWFKHAFITKFNELSASFYDDYALGLAQDIASSRNKHAFTDFSDQVCRRMGFTPIPLICLLFMVCSKSFRINGPLPWFLVFLFYLCLVSTKVFNSIILLGWAQHLTAAVRTQSTKPSGTVVNSQVIPKKEEKTATKKPAPPPPPPPDLSTISTVDGTSIMGASSLLEAASGVLDAASPTIESSVISSVSLPSSLLNNGDHSLDFVASSSSFSHFNTLPSFSSSPSPSPSRSRHNTPVKSNISDIFLPGSSKHESCLMSEGLTSSPKPSVSDFSSPEVCRLIDDLIDNKLEELNPCPAPSACNKHLGDHFIVSSSLSRGDENVGSAADPESGIDAEDKDSGGYDALRQDVFEPVSPSSPLREKPVCDDEDNAAEPFMFKLSNSKRSLSQTGEGCVPLVTTATVGRYPSASETPGNDPIMEKDSSQEQHLAEHSVPPKVQKGHQPLSFPAPSPSQEHALASDGTDSIDVEDDRQIWAPDHKILVKEEEKRDYNTPS